MNSLGSCINTFGRYKKVNPKNELGTLLTFTFNHFVLWKDLNLLHSAKCSVSTQLTYMQKYSTIKFQSVQQGELQYKGVLRSRLFLHLNLATLPVLWFLQFFRLLDILSLWIFTTFGTTLQILQNQHWFVKLWFLPETLVRHNHKTLPSLKM